MHGRSTVERLAAVVSARQYARYKKICTDPVSLTGSHNALTPYPVPFPAHITNPHIPQECISDQQGDQNRVQSEARVLRIIKVLRILKIIRILKAFKVVE